MLCLDSLILSTFLCLHYILTRPFSSMIRPLELAIVDLIRHRGQSKWVARIKLSNKSRHLGYFSDEDEAAREFDKYAARAGRPTNFESSKKQETQRIIPLPAKETQRESDKKLETQSIIPVPAKETQRESDQKRKTLPVDSSTKVIRKRLDRKMSNSSSDYYGVHWNRRDRVCDY